MNVKLIGNIRLEIINHNSFELIKILMNLHYEILEKELEYESIYK